MKLEFEIVREFTHKLGLENQTDGSLFIYNTKNGELREREREDKPIAKKPDGYYYFEGITFILDAKKEGGEFIGQLEDYMKLEKNPNFIGFKYNGVIFECYVRGVLQKGEVELQDKDYYKNKYFNIKINNENIVSESAKKLANLFRNSNIDKQMNVPFIGAVMLCLRFQKDIDTTSTQTILNSVKIGLNSIIQDNQNINRKQKREFLKKTLEDDTLKKAKTEDLFTILQEISTIYNFINISSKDIKGHDIMNNFLKIFRKWNSADAKEKGEVFTPDHIANLMYKIADCSKDNTILDPTCGSGTFLVNAMMNMLIETDNHEEQKNIKENQLLGIEINAFNSTLAGMNMMLHGDGASNIYFDNCFTKIKELQNCYDRVLMNPPFSVRDKELKFVLVSLENIKDNGILAVILPKTCVKGTDKENINFLKKIFEIAKLKAVVSLPNELFCPNAGVSTCILVLQKTQEGHSGKTLLVNCNDDCFILQKEQASRIDKFDKWKDIEKQIIKAFKEEYDEFIAIEKELKYTDELLFEAYSSHRNLNVDRITFERYLRENIAAKMLCGIYNKTNIENVELNDVKYGLFSISDLLVKVEKGNTKSIDRKLENKYNLNGLPLIIAKKDNNGIGGMTTNYNKSYNDKIVIICGGDGGGGKTYYCDFDFCATGFVMICDLQEQYKNIYKYAKFYLSVIISERLYKTIGHGRTISEIPNIKIQLPVNENNEIDFEYMSNYIKNLEFSELF